MKIFAIVLAIMGGCFLTASIFATKNTGRKMANIKTMTGEKEKLESNYSFYTAYSPVTQGGLAQEYEKFCKYINTASVLFNVDTVVSVEGEKDLTPVLALATGEKEGVRSIPVKCNFAGGSVAVFRIIQEVKERFPIEIKSISLVKDGCCLKGKFLGL